MSEKTVAIIQTSLVSTEHLKRLFAELLPGVRTMNIVDDSLLSEVMRVGHVTPRIVRSLCAYAQQAEAAGADALLNQCSSVGEAAEIAARTVSVPFARIDRPMAREAVTIGSRIAVVATVESTLGPSTALVRQEAGRAGVAATVDEHLVDGALRILMEHGDRETHNSMILDTLNAIASDYDVVVLAQGSMVVLEPRLIGFPIPVLTSPRSGVLQVRDLLRAGEAAT